ncbi:MAG: aminopeptidase P family protein [Chloroflexi bacterium]|nr:aminopeptidase P family protein [Chloroflexota bacterium]
MEEILLSRLNTLRTRMDEAGLQGMVILNEANRRYLSGFTGSTGWLVITPDRALLVTDGRYWERAQREAPHFELVPVRTRYDVTLRMVFADLHGDVGFEAQTITVHQFEQFLRPVVGVSWKAADELPAQLREVKDAQEMEHIRRAAAITDAAVAQLPHILRPGITERETAWELEKFMREQGAEGLAFPIIVAFGENSALPHAEPEDRALQENMAVCVDLGARVSGYCADLTRSFWYGPDPEPDYVRAWTFVRRALVAALMGLQPGNPARLVDALARDMLKVGGYGDDAFRHSVGHGVGLDIHERPALSRFSDHVLRAGMVVTVEPGVYLAHRWGIRLEELAVLWDNGPEIISRAPMSMIFPAP